MKVLHRNLKKKWFDMILSGEKKQEYRDLKPYWKKRLLYSFHLLYREFDVIIFKNGYKKDAPTMTVKCKGIVRDFGYKKWGAEKDKQYFVISLGKILKNN